MKVTEYHGCAKTVREEPPTLFELNTSVPPEDDERLTAQAAKVYRLFKHGETVTTGQLTKAAAQYGARICELRKWLMGQGWSIPCTRVPGGNNTYKMERI